MLTLQIRELPDHIYLALKAAAERNGISLNEQAILELAKGLNVATDLRERRKKIIATIKEERYLWERWADVDISTWIREDRDCY